MLDSTRTSLDRLPVHPYNPSACPTAGILIELPTYGEMLCRLYQSKEYPVHAVIAGAPIMHSKPKTWFNAATVVKCGYPIACVPIVDITKAAKWSSSKNNFNGVTQFAG